MAKTLQDRLKQRRSSNFVGREQQLELFRQNLRRSLDSEDYYFIFSVHGQGGVGKTTLLNKYRGLAKEADTLTAYTNEETKSIPEVLARFAQQLKEQDTELTEFDKRYKVYLQEKKRLEADPEAPKGAWKLGGRIVARSSKTLAKEFIPGSGLLLDGLDADAIGDQMGEWASFVKKRLTNKDEVQLLLQPIETLTPLFLKGLEKHAKNHRICLCFDTYEETYLYLDEWLRHLLEGQYGDAPENLLFVIAGREPLNPNAWSDYGDFIATIPLEAFSELEAKTYLEQKGITDEAVVDSILGLSGRLPVLLATLAEAAKNATVDLTDPCATAVERFLKWIDDPVQRDLALYAALPRKLNQDIIQCLLPEGADAKALFQWLSTQPFVQKHQEGYWVYHGVVRELMLRHQFQLSRDTWTALHNRLANLNDARAEQLSIVDREEQFSNEEWLAYALERTYHGLCAAYQRELPNAIEDFMTVFRSNGASIAAIWGGAFAESGLFGKETSFGELIVQGVEGFSKSKDDKTLNLFRHLSEHFTSKYEHDLYWLYYNLGVLETNTKNYSQAIDACQKAIQIYPEGSLAYFNLGNVYLGMGELDNAIISYNEAINFNPEFHEVYTNLGTVLKAKGELDKAIMYYQKAIKINPESPLDHFNLGNALNEKRELNNAIKSYNKAIKIDPEYIDPYINLGNLHSQMGNFDKAIHNYQKVIDIDPEHVLAHNNLGIALSDQGEVDKAIICYHKAIKLNPEYADPYNNLGIALKQKGEIDNSIESYQKAIKLNPEYALAYFNLGVTFREIGEIDKEIEHYEKAINLDPEYIPSYINLGLALAKKGEIDNAIQNFRKALKFNPRYSEAYFNLGTAHISKGEINIAIEYYKKTIKFNPHYIDAYYNLGIAFSKIGETNKAIQNYKKAINFNPRYSEAYFNLGNAFSDKGEIDNAIKNYQKAISLKPDDATAYYNLGIALRQKGQLDKAIQNYHKAITLKPDDADAYNNLGYALSDQGQLDKAIENYYKAIQITPEDAMTYNNLGAALHDQGQLDKAIENYKKAIRVNPEYAAAYNNLGLTYLSKGQLSKAKATFEHGLELDKGEEFFHMNYAHCLLAEQQQEKAMDHYRQSREGFEDKAKFFQDMESDYTDFNLAQYNIPKNDYFALIQQLKEEME